MAENLKTTKYNDGTNIPLGSAWVALSTPGYCWYNNDAATHKSTYGALYNWHAVNTGNLCPVGWHVPPFEEWSVLTVYLRDNVGGKLKEAGLAHWFDPNTGATNETGFSALPGGYRYYDGLFSYIGYNGFWWSSTGEGTSIAWYRNMGYGSIDLNPFLINASCGLSVRCVRDL
jgi:uncharacterized protein (TIGR02145 family)